ncbi:MAG: hypothetical protein US22_C0065G0001 [candidate division TM6 bacterium GW2011_GWF2_36_6]|jgi:hypothetical protein|nr:MAG: hypothetical protein US22_C0065G0001 [candidate division TM6 bacterium GW2011_GWF2_36_6]
MKKLFPLMFALVFANQAFALESEAVVTDETTRFIETDEAIKVEAAAVYNELKKDGLTDAQIVVAIEEKLRSETTQEAYHSVLSKKNQKYIVWGLVGVLATVSVCFAGRWAYGKLTAEKKDANEDEPQKLDGGIELQEGVNKGLAQRRAEPSHHYDLRTRHPKTK